MRISKASLAVPFLLLTSGRPICAQDPAAPTPIQHVDWYGLRSVDPAAAAKALGFGVGSDSSVDRKAAEARLRELPGIEDAKITWMLMPGQAIALVGVRERSMPVLQCFEAPTGEARLPVELVEAYDLAQEQSLAAMRKRVFGEDRDEGHALSRYEPERRHQLRALELANAQTDLVSEVLKESADARHRMIAAWAIAYVDDKASIVPDLARAMRDPDAGVRNNAVRALSVMATWARSQDDFALELDSSPLFEMLESLAWTDRNKSAALLSDLARDDVALQKRLQERSLASLSEMARWTSLGHAIFSVQILASIADKDATETSKTIWGLKDPAARRKTIEQIIEAARARSFDK